MEFKNPYYRDHIQNLRLTLEENKPKISILIVITSGLILMILFQPVNSNFTSAIVFAGGLFLLIRFHELGFRWLSLNPNEQSISIEGSRLILAYPKPKKNVEIPLSDIKHIAFNKLSDNNEATIESNGTDQDLIKMGIDFESHSVNSLSEENWKHVASENGLKLTITYDLDLKGNKDVYVIQKEENEDVSIPKSEFQLLLSQRPDIKLLGIQEYYDSSNNNDREPMEQYSLNTRSGKESFDFVLGKIAVTYSKGETAEEIVNIAESMGWTHKKL